MIVINKGTSNVIDLTLSENVTITNPYFLFRFVNDDTNVEYACIITNTSLYTERYDRFDLIEGTTVTLGANGFYHYYVYEQASAVNLDYNSAGACLEYGKANVTNSTITEPVTEFEATDNYIPFVG